MITASRRAESASAIVIGGGVAGLAAAVRLATRIPARIRMRAGPVLLICRGEPGLSCASRWAQGGMAVATGRNDVKQHAADTVEVGAGLSSCGAAERVAALGAETARWLESLGVVFDRGIDGERLLAKEAGHQKARILRAEGDQIGVALTKALRDAAQGSGAIVVRSHHRAQKLLCAKGRCCGVLACDADGQPVAYHSAAVVLATGGVGQLFAHTTNPNESTGEGLALAASAGAKLMDLEFVQFHPTALATQRDPLSLVSEAVRGEGATLWNNEGHRFMAEADPRAELAPRDVVARAIFQQLREGREVSLDARHLGEAWPRRFPRIFELAIQDGIDPRRASIPVTPAAHYHMGGVAVGGSGRTSVRGLWATGEVSCSGMHGGNRLASNSLLEAAAMADLLAEDVARCVGRNPFVESVADATRAEYPAAYRHDEHVDDSLRKLMWDHVGLVRDEEGLKCALHLQEEMVARTPPDAVVKRAHLLVAELITRAALARRESRGAHVRSDFVGSHGLARHSYSWLSNAQGFLREAA